MPFLNSLGTRHGVARHRGADRGSHQMFHHAPDTVWTLCHRRNVQKSSVDGPTLLSGVRWGGSGNTGRCRNVGPRSGMTSRCSSHVVTWNHRAAMTYYLTVVETPEVKRDLNLNLKALKLHSPQPAMWPRHHIRLVPFLGTSSRHFTRNKTWFRQPNVSYLWYSEHSASYHSRIRGGCANKTGIMFRRSSTTTACDHVIPCFHILSNL